MRLRRALSRFYNKAEAAYDRCLAPLAYPSFFRQLLRQTHNFDNTTWLGNPIWQNVLDLWSLQEVLAVLRPELLIESGTNRGGSSLFFAHLFDIMGHGRVITIDIERLHHLSHPRITYLFGSSTSEEIVSAVRAQVVACHGPVMVILDSDHSEQHVLRELQCYTPFVTVGSYCLVQDGVIDTLLYFRPDRPGPLPAIETFLRTTDEFEVDEKRCQRFLISHHPRGWLKRKSDRRARTGEPQ